MTEAHDQARNERHRASSSSGRRDAGIAAVRVISPARCRVGHRDCSAAFRNPARFAEKLPVTVRFANEVGAILRDLPDDVTPEARYAFHR